MNVAGIWQLGLQGTGYGDLRWARTKPATPGTSSGSGREAGSSQVEGAVIRRSGLASDGRRMG